MRIEVPYGKEGKQSLDVPDDNFLGTIRPNEVDSGFDLDAVRKGLDHPYGAQKLEEFLEGAKDAVFIVNDGTRPTPTARVLHVLEESVKLQNHRFLIATGAHRAPTDEEYEQIFGERLHHLRDRLHAHDARKDHMVLLGETRNGTAMWMNELAVKADRLVIITSVEPHYFAGYTGGRKSFLPGVAAYKTIEQNHRLAMSKDAQALKLDGNPVHEDMMDAIKELRDKPIFAIQVVLDRHQQIYRVATGDLNKSFHQAVRWANQVFCVDIHQKADIVVSVASYPMDIDLYQSQKAIENGRWALKPGGSIILVSKCRSGIGDEAFYDQLSRSKDPDQVLRNLDLEYKLGHHKAAKMAELAKCAEIHAVTSLQDKTLQDINITPFASVQEAVDAALRRRPNAKLMVIFEGSVVVPRLV
jgi:nickel-dependent lactate racemase